MSTLTAAAGGLSLAGRAALRQGYLTTAIAAAGLLPLIALIIAVSIS